ncbi:MAG TPA: hypothetical protein ACFYD6_06235 [Candidatus Brocadiia bacterium]|nr:hypothetical protein [Planctomycetota bacterium]MDO8092492.1 hypothetical protein [Candidatus Brocadiales bacterium]
MVKRKKTTPQFAICVNTDDPDLLTPRRIYQVLPDENAVKSNYIRVVDNEGEDYLYPAAYFILIDFPPAIKHVLLQTAGVDR